MPSLASLIGLTILFAGLSAQAAWLDVLRPVNLSPDVGAPILFPPETDSMDPAQLAEKVEAGAYAILEGQSKNSEFFGFHATQRIISVRSAVDLRHPKLPIIWEEAAQVPFFEIPHTAILFAQERWDNAPLMAGLRRGAGALLWVAAGPGAKGHERFPYLPQALADLGLDPPVRSKNLWVFFDSSYRLRIDPNYMARKWRQNGISALHIAAWHYYDSDPQRDQYLRNLIGACHRNAILVYAWLELPHVSEGFWARHPEWREKTASGADAHLDWRKLMNLRNPQCKAEVSAGVRDLLTRFDWDGVNLAELYFESLEGHANPSRFTPMNADVRKEFRDSHHFDPADLFDPASPRFRERDTAALEKFLNYRAQLARRLQQEWIGEVDALRKQFPHLDLVLTHVDNLLQPDTRAQIGADAKSVLPLMEKHDFTFLIEDPATAWHLGPQRYPEISRRYAPIARRRSNLAIDINVVERFQDVYPTKQQTGTELFQEVHLAGGAFARVALYFENSIPVQDWPLLGAALAQPKSIRRESGRTIIDSPTPIGLRWQGPASVNGSLWPVTAGGVLWLPPGRSVVEPSSQEAPVRILDLNAALRSAAVRGTGLEFSYEAPSRALVRLNRMPVQILLDGVPTEPKVWVFDEDWILVLPKGQHLVSLKTDSGV